MTLSSTPVANSAAPLQLSAAEAWQHLKELDRQIDQVVLQRQHPITGLLPASTANNVHGNYCLLYTSPSPRDLSTSRMPSSA